MGYQEENETPPALSDIRDGFRAMWGQSVHSVSLLIVWVCVGLFLATGILSGFGFTSRHSVVAFLGLSRVGILEHGLFFQLLTAPLLHASVTHLLFNMLALWMLGPSVEQAMGRLRYIGFSLACALVSMAGFLVLAHEPGELVMGYSGVIFGILTAQAVYFPNNRLMFCLFFPMKMKYAVLIMGAMELYLTISPERAGVAHSAHLFGALAGFVYVRLMQWQDGYSRSKDEPRRRPRTGASHSVKRQKIPKEL
ncbi:MAG: rhomboid family intramembrane serine protease [Lentisphaerae bacterium]|nr:rhomboid family intramembrane serine protease [Lentisphaerota bacterium]OQC11769.1 MAG: Rhomboid protease GluP [Lentisphaerae bacterium ADurb.Bin082]HQL86583.1 rhomboid family intramembrane serine protease [Lentisphaeria bacterium]